MKVLTPTAGPAILGAVVALGAYPPGVAWPLAVVGPALLWAWAARCQPFRAGIMGFGYGIGFFTALVYWLVHTLGRYGGFPTWLAVLGLVLLVLYLSIYPALAARYISRASRSLGPGATVVLAPLAWCGLEYVRSHLFSGFGWGGIELSLWQTPWALDLAPVVGANGVALIVAVAGSSFTWAMLRVAPRASGHKPGGASLSPALLALLAIAALPHLPNGTGEPDRTVDVVVVQGNISQDRKWDAEALEETVEKYAGLTHDEIARGGPAELVVWPETAVPFFIQDRSRYREEVEEVASRDSLALVTGAPAYVLKEGRIEDRNAVYVIPPSGKLGRRYEKLHLVPFGEYVPLGRYLPFIKKLVVAAGDFTPGEHPVQLPTTDDGPVVGPLVCFESIFSEYAANHVEDGAQMLALVTNDAWFGDTSAPYQHLGYAAWRAAETGLPLARAANTGVSAFFDHRGRLISTSRLGQIATLRATLAYPERSHPVETAVQPYVGPSCLLLAGLGLFAMLRGPGKPDLI